MSVNFVTSLCILRDISAKLKSPILSVPPNVRKPSGPKNITSPATSFAVSSATQPISSDTDSKTKLPVKPPLTLLILLLENIISCSLNSIISVMVSVKSIVPAPDADVKVKSKGAEYKSFVPLINITCVLNIITLLQPTKSVPKDESCEKVVPSYKKGLPLPSVIKTFSVPLKLNFANLTLPEPPNVIPALLKELLSVNCVQPLPADLYT